MLAGRLRPAVNYVPSAGESLVRYRFGYAQSYRQNPASIPLGPGLPFTDTSVNDWGNEEMPAELQDAMPDGWGRRAIMSQYSDAAGEDLQDDVVVADPALFMLESSSDRFGAIDFQSSPDHYSPREYSASLEDLQQAAEAAEDGEVPPRLRTALASGTSLGGARPKAALTDEGSGWMAKFESRNDLTPSIQWEHAATILAGHAGIEAAETHMREVRGKMVLLSRRFDRPGEGRRHMVLTARTLLGYGGGDGSYPAFADVLSRHGESAGSEVFDRLAFNIAVSNTDDHHKNHAAFWDGTELRLAPAYDLEPQPRDHGTRGQRMAVDRSGSRRSNLPHLISASADYGLSATEAEERVAQIIDTVEKHWSDAADAAMLSRREARRFRSRLLTPGATEGRPRMFGAPASGSDSRQYP